MGLKYHHWPIGTEANRYMTRNGMPDSTVLRFHAVRALLTRELGTAWGDGIGGAREADLRAGIAVLDELHDAAIQEGL